VRRRTARAFTLLEVMVVGLAGVLVMLIVAQAWSWLGRSVSQTRSAARIVHELRLAADLMADDFGRAMAARTTDQQSVELNIDGPPYNGVAQWNAPDMVIRYELQDGRIVRVDVNTGQEFAVAAYMSAMAVQSQGQDTIVTLTASLGSTQRTITLRLEEP
jgi:Tfp pilus assembly protein PilW